MYRLIGIGHGMN